MKAIHRALSALLLALASFVALAVPGRADEAAVPECGPFGDIQTKLARDYGEFILLAGKFGSEPGSAIVFANPDGTTWTIVSLLPDGTGCLAASGDSWLPGAAKAGTEG